MTLDRHISRFLSSLPPGASFDVHAVCRILPRRNWTHYSVNHALLLRDDLARTGKNTWVKTSGKWLAFQVLQGRRVLVGQASRKKKAQTLFPGSQVERNPGYIDWTGRPESLAG